MNILIITGQIPCPPTSGGKKDVYNKIIALSNKGHHIFLCIFDYPNELEKIQYHKTPNLPVKKIFLYARRKNISSILRLLPMQVISRQLSQRELNNLCNYLSQNELNLVICENLFNMDIASKIATKLNVPIFLRSQNIESNFFSEISRAENFFIMKILLKLESIKIKLYEKNINQYKNLQCVLDIDNSFNKQNVTKTIKQYFLPAFCAENETHFSLGDKFAKRLLFVGSLNMAPNIEGIKWFIQKIWQKILCEIPECKLLIAGSSPGKGTYNFLTDVPNCNVIIDKVDISSEYLDRPIFINPIRFGAGVSIKTIEAMRYGLPIVSTRTGSRGSNLVADKEAIITDDNNYQDFASKVIQLMRDDIMRKRLGNYSRKAFDRTFSKEILIKQLEIILDEETKRYKNRPQTLNSSNVFYV